MAEETPGNPQVLVRLPSKIGILLLRDAKEQKCTVQAVLLGIAAKHYGIDVEPPKRGARKKPVEPTEE
jgi:hypothetical protein